MFTGWVWWLMSITVFGRPRWVVHLRSGVWDHPCQHGEISIFTNTKISWVYVPVIPTTREAKVQESPEPKRWRLQWTEIPPLHSSLSDRARLHLKRKGQERKSATLSQKKICAKDMNTWLKDEHKMTNDHMETSPSSPVIKEIKITVRYHFPLSDCPALGRIWDPGCRNYG